MQNIVWRQHITENSRNPNLLITNTAIFRPSCIGWKYYGNTYKYVHTQHDYML